VLAFKVYKGYINSKSKSKNRVNRVSKNRVKGIRFVVNLRYKG